MTLAVRRMPPSYIAENIRAIVDQVLLEWEIPHHKISAILSDNGSNIVAAFRGHFCTSSEDEDESGDGDIDQQGKSSQIQDEGSIELDVSNFEEEIHHESAFHDFRRVSCLSHTLQLVVCSFDTVTTFKGLLKCTHELVRNVLFHKSDREVNLFVEKASL